MPDPSQRKGHYDWPSSLDALAAAPAHHRLLMENDHVRVLETCIPPGEKTAVHTHRWRSVQYCCSWSDFIRRDQRGNIMLDSRTINAPAVGTALWSEPYSPHSVENIGAADIRFIVVELKERVRMLEPAELKDFANRYTAAWCSQDPISVAAFFSPGGSLKVNDGPAAIGRDAIAETAHSFMSAFPDLRVMMNDLRIVGERVEYYWTLEGRNTGPSGSGRRVRINGFEVWQFTPDGLIEASEGHFDGDDYKRQLEGRD